MIRLRSLQQVALAAVLAVLPLRAFAQCPNEVLYEPVGPGSADVGWNGIAHDMITGGVALPLAISCGASTPPCGTCTITGFASSEGLRCQDDTSKRCSVATEATDCGADGPCRHFVAPPQGLGFGGIALCILPSLAGNVSGTVDVESGAFAPVVPLHLRIHTGRSIEIGCPRCAGDPVASDGVAGGTCDYGIRQGLACDADATSTLSDFGATSFDCPPEVTPTTQSFAAGTFAASTGTLTRTLTAESPRCNALPPTTPCFCNTCNNANAEPCAANADCPPSGGNPGICGGARCVGGTNDGAPCTAASMCPGGICFRTGRPTAPNACLDDTTSPNDCADLGGGVGECTAGPIDTYCSNHPNRGCRFDADCDGVPLSCTAKLRPCFPDNGVLGAAVTVSGTATPPVAGVAEPTDLAVLQCTGPMNDAFFDQAASLPGLVRHVQPGRLTFGEACPATPDDCRPSLQPRKSSLQLADREADDRDALAWKWTAGAATAFADLGDPVATDGYALCLYDDTGLRTSVGIPAGGTCAGKPCWRRNSSGFRYANKTAAPGGITQLALKAGGDGKAQLRVKGKGALLPLPALPSLSGTLDVQLRHRASGRCWGSTFVPPFDSRTDEQLKDKAD